MQTEIFTPKIKPVLQLVVKRRDNHMKFDKLVFSDILVKTLRPAATRTFLNIAMSIDVIEEKSLRNIPIPEDSTKDSRQSNVESVPADLQQTSTAMPIEIVTPKIN